MLLTALALAIGLYGGAGHTLQDTQMTGSSLLSESAGAYVLVAVLAFCLGSIACLVRRPGK